MIQRIKQRSKGALLFGLLCVASMTVNAETHFEVMGKGFIDVTPDEATFRATVTEVGETAEDAQSAVNNVIANLENAVAQYDLKKGSLDSSALSFYPEYKWDSSSKKQVFVGYRVSRNLTFTSKGIADVGSIVQSLAALGATQISPPSFGYSQAEQATADAMRKAVKHALEKLELMASAAGMSVDKVESVTEITGSSPPRIQGVARFESANYADAPPSVSVGTIRYTSEVQVVATAY
jgi:uncharacterized protein YggE